MKPVSQNVLSGAKLSKGLYPARPNPSKEKVEAPHAFWVIEHGIKASGMPTWGKSMSDEYVCNMIAFLQKLLDLDEGRYKDMVAHIADPLVRKLADGIIESQRREIGEIKALVAELEQKEVIK